MKIIIYLKMLILILSKIFLNVMDFTGQSYTNY